jgi:hypothetical protein
MGSSEDAWAEAAGASANSNNALAQPCRYRNCMQSLGQRAIIIGCENPVLTK